MGRDLVIGMAGSGGDGVVSAGDGSVAAAAVKLSRHHDEELRLADPRRRVVVPVRSRPIFGCGGKLDVAVALNWGRTSPSSAAS